MIDQVEHVHRPARLAKAFDASEALLESRWIPWQIYIDECAERLQVESFAGGVGGDDEANVSLLDGLLDVITLDGGKRVAPEDTALAGASVHSHRFMR